jgi:hypothetical protein
VGETSPHVIAAAERLRGIERPWPGRGTRPAAVVCLGDRIALGVYRALAAAGLSVPGGVSVVSFDDDSDLAVWLRPALSSVAPPHRELATAAVALALGPDDPAGGRRRLGDAAAAARVRRPAVPGALTGSPRGRAVPPGRGAAGRCGWYPIRPAATTRRTRVCPDRAG